MLTKEVSQKYLNNALVSIHAKRAKSLFEACWSLTKQTDLTITSLGINKDGNAYDKHKIKSVDRLVGNSQLQAEIPIIYKEFFSPFISSASILYILVDWSGCCRSDVHMLRASVAFEGRSITIYNEIHPQKKLGNRQVHNQFLARLKQIIPIDKKVVIITDAGFNTPWFKAVLKLGWNYIGRLTSYTMICLEKEKKWSKVKDFYKTKSTQVKYIGKAIIGKRSSTPVEGHVYRYKTKVKNRKGLSRYPDVNKSFSKLYKTPWLLATSLKNIEYGGNFIKDAYQKRMQIEQNFRDEKDPRFGFGWRFSRNKCYRRIAVLCLIAHITAFFLLTIGIVAEKLGLQKYFQVNTERKKRVLSLLTLAKRILKHPPPLELSKIYERNLEQLNVSYRNLYIW